MKKRVIAATMTLVLLGGQMSSVSATDINQTSEILQDSVTWLDTDQLCVNSSEDSDTSELLSDVDTGEGTAGAELEEGFASEDIGSSEFEAGENESSLDSGDEWVVDENGIYPELEEDGIEIVEETFEDIDSSTEDEIIADEEETEEDLFLLAADGQDGTYSGTDGNISWSVANGTLTISGTGAMNDYSSPEEVPWYVPCVQDYIESEEGIITTVVIESGVKTLGSYAFYYLRHMTSISVPETVTKIGERCFDHCESVKEIEILGEVYEVGDYAFSTCTSLETIQLAGKSKYFGKLGEYVFYNCSSLRSIVFGENTYASGIDYTSFIGCTSLRSITFGFSHYYGPYQSLSGVALYEYNNTWTKLIWYSSFASAQDGLEIEINAKTEIGPYAVRNNRGISRFKLKDSVKKVSEGAFLNCGMRSITLGRYLETIGSQAFAECDVLKSITIPGGVTYIGENAFRGCSSLNTMYFRGDAPEIGGSIFSPDITATVYYPAGNTTWTQEVMNELGGNLTWREYSPELLPFSTYCHVELDKTSFIYDGTAKTPEVTVNGGLATSGVFYSAPEYENNILSGTASVTVNGKGEFTGSITETFAIQPHVVINTDPIVYDREKHHLDISVEGGATLYFSTTTPLTVDNYEAEGTIEIPSRISAGSTTVYYIAVPEQNPSEASCVSGETQLIIDKASQGLSADLLQSSLYIGESTQIMASARAGAINYTSENEDIATVDANGVVTGVAEGGTKIHVTAAETANYQEESLTLTVTVSPQEETSLYDCDIEVETGLVYLGMPVEPKVTIHYDGHTLVQDRDYSLQYMNNDSVGTGTVRITGRGYYIGTVTRTFEILDEEDPSEKSISECEITLAESTLTYKGSAQIPEVTVKDNSTVLEEGNDYILAVSGDAVSEDGDAVDTGTYTLSVIGQGTYIGLYEVPFEITRAEPTLTYTDSQVEKTTEDETFTNTLTAVTDGVITYSSEDSSVATVNVSSGEVTIKGVGETVITATAVEGRNYLAGEASYTLTVTEPERILDIETLSFSFKNNRTAFGYPTGYRILLPIYEFIFGKTTKANLYYTQQLDWGGSCAGFSAASSLLTDGTAGVSLGDFDPGATAIRDLSVSSINEASGLGMDVRSFLEALQVAQKTQLFQDAWKSHRIYTKDHLRTGRGNLNGLYNTVKQETQAGKPVILALTRATNVGHAILAYGVEDQSEEESRILLYDNNYPMEERYLTLQKDSSGDYMKWSYNMREGVDWGSEGPNGATTSIGYIPYSVVKEIWATKGHLAENENVVRANSKSLAIYESDSTSPVATVTGGELATQNSDIHIIEELTEEEKGDQVFLSMPINVYTFDNLDKSISEFEVSMVDSNLGTTVSTTANSVTLAVDDSCNLNATYIDASEDDTYCVTLNSTFDYDEDNVVVTGVGNGEIMEVSQSKGNINISNCQIISISIDGVEIHNYTITALAGEGGTITPEGESVVSEGSDIVYSLQAEPGYKIRDVLVDGISVGPVESYVFRNVSANHVIRGEFIKISGDNPDPSSGGGKKQPNSIAAKNLVLTTAARAQSFPIGASAKGNAPLSYRSNNPSIKVSKDGKITVPQDYVGQAAITISAAETAQYTKTSKTITVMVNPTGTTLKKLKKGGSGKANVTWKRNKKVTGYQISYSMSSDFSGEKIKTVKKNKTVKLVLKKLKKNKKYYVRIRTYKTVGGKKYYSSWSKAKSLKAK